MTTYAVLSIRECRLQAACDLAATAGAAYLNIDPATARDTAHDYLQRNVPGASGTIVTSGNTIEVDATVSVTAIGNTTVSARATARTLPIGRVHRADLVR